MAELLVTIVAEDDHGCHTSRRFHGIGDGLMLIASFRSWLALEQGPARQDVDDFEQNMVAAERLVQHEGVVDRKQAAAVVEANAGAPVALDADAQAALKVSLQAIRKRHSERAGAEVFTPTTPQEFEKTVDEIWDKNRPAAAVEFVTEDPAETIKGIADSVIDKVVLPVKGAALDPVLPKKGMKLRAELLRMFADNLERNMAQVFMRMPPDANTGDVRRALEGLAAEGVLMSFQRDRMTYWRVVKNSPFGRQKTGMPSSADTAND